MNWGVIYGADPAGCVHYYLGKLNWLHKFEIFGRQSLCLPNFSNIIPRAGRVTWKGTYSGDGKRDPSSKC